MEHKSVFWEMTQCSLIHNYGHFEGSKLLLIQSQRVASLLPASLFLQLTLRHWRWWQYVLRNNYQTTRRHVSENTFLLGIVKFKALLHFTHVCMIHPGHVFRWSQLLGLGPKSSVDEDMIVRLLDNQHLTLQLFRGNRVQSDLSVANLQVKWEVAFVIPAGRVFWKEPNSQAPYTSRAYTKNNGSHVRVCNTDCWSNNLSFVLMSPPTRAQPPSIFDLSTVYS
jgi:hypothetical protein